MEIDNLYTTYNSQIDIWLEWIINLLENHTIELYDNGIFLYIVMGGDLYPPSGDVCKTEYDILNV